MWDPNEPIQIIGCVVDKDTPIYEWAEIQNAMTQFNEDWKLQNRYDKAINKLERIEHELEDKIKFCEMEAEGTVNDAHCRIAILFYKRLLKIIRGEEEEV